MLKLANVTHGEDRVGVHSCFRRNEMQLPTVRRLSDSNADMPFTSS